MDNINVINSYETLFVVTPQLSEDETKATIAKFTDLVSANGTIESINEWGKRRLAYPINDLNEGYYVLVNFTSVGSFPIELERIFGITEEIMRSMIIRIEKKKGSKSPVSKEAPAVVETIKADSDDE